MKRIITFFLFLIFACSLSAQVETRGSDFWVTFGNNANAPSSGVYLQLRIVAKQAVTGKITFTEDSKVVPFSISENGVFNYTLSDSERAASYSLQTGINSKSIRIQTDNDIPVTVYAFNTYQALADATNLLPVPTLGNDYYHLGRAANQNDRADNYMVVATQDNTILYENGQDVAHLSTGQVYFRRADGTKDLSGYHITSNKPIAYFTAHNYQIIDGGGDNIFQQLTSINTWGTNFIVPVSLRGVELVRVIASHNGTKVTQTGATLPKSSTPANPTYTLNAGEYVEFQISLANNGCHIQSDKPIQVCSYMVGMNYGSGVLTNGDESLVWIPPVEQSVQTALIAPFGSERLTSHYALIVTPTATKGKTTIKIGTGETKLLDSQNGKWYDNPTSGMSFYNLQLTETSASYVFDNEEGLIVYGYGFGYFISYYYMAASSIRQLNPSFYINDVHFQNANGQTYCNIPFKFRAELKFPLSSSPGHIRWYINGTEETSAQDKIEWTKPSLPLNTPQEIKLVVVSAENKQLTTKSTITVVDPKPLKITGDPYICPPETKTVLTAESGPSRYQWYYNGNPILGAIENTLTVTKDKAGKYSVIGQYGKCQSPMSDTVTVVDGCKAILKMAYDGNGQTSGTVPTDEKSPYVDNAEVTVKSVGDLKRTDATIIGWSFSKNDVITEKNKVPADLKKENDKFHITKDTTLFAVWAVDKTGPDGKPDGTPDYDQFGVTYDGNKNTSGTAPTDPNRYNSNTDVTLKEQGDLKRDSAVFIGWSSTQAPLVMTKSAEPSDLKKGKDKFKITADAKFFAVWAIDKTGPGGKPDGKPDYDQAGLTYDGNENTGGTAPADPNRYNDNDDVTVLDKGDLARMNAVFLGWLFEKKSLITKKADVPAGIMVKGNTFKYSANTHTLFAVWGEDKTGPEGKPDSKPDYLQNGVTYNGNENTGGVAPTDVNRYNNGDAVTVKDSGTLVRTEAVFLGWSFTKKALITKAADIPSDLKKRGATFVSTTDTTLFAVWAIDKTGPGGKPDGKPDFDQEGVTYDGNENTGGTVPTDAGLYNDGDDVTVKDKGNLTRMNAVFIGWLFEKKPVVTKKADVPTGMKQANDKFKYSATTAKLFAVWGEDKTGPNGTPDDIPDYLQMGITYNGNKNTGGTAPKDPKRYNKDNNVTLLDKGDLTRTEATFIGWSFSAQELIKSKAEENAVTDLKKPTETFAITTDTTVYAVWAIDKTGPGGKPDGKPDYDQFGVTYNGNKNTGGTAPTDANRYNKDEEVTLKDKGDLTRTETTFIGWSFSEKDVITKAADVPSDLKKKDEKFPITADTTVYAVWAIDKTGPGGKPDGKPDYAQKGLSYDGNENTSGTAPTDANLYNDGDKVTVKDKGDLARMEAVFIGWLFEKKPLVTTKTDEPNNRMKAGDKFDFDSATPTLFAVWAVDKTGPNGTPDEVPDYLQKGVTYEGNGNTGGTAPEDPNRYNDSTMVTVLGKGTLERDSAVFLGWSFSQKNLITTKEEQTAVIDLMKPDTTFKIMADVTLYAVWAKDANKNGVPDYNEVYVTWHPGVQFKVLGIPKPEAVSKGKNQLTSKGYAVRGFVLLGWSNRPKPVVRTQAAENNIKPLSKIGDFIDIQRDTTVYAIWAIDANNNGAPDYNDNGKEYQTRRASLRRLSEDEAVAIRVWAHDGMLYIASNRRTHADVYTRSGALYKRIDVAEGQINEPLPAGFYVVAIEGMRYKVFVK